MGEVAMLQQVDEPEHGDGDGGGEEWGPVYCEWCEGVEFSLCNFSDLTCVICTECHMPQSNIFWVMLEAPDE